MMLIRGLMGGQGGEAPPCWQGGVLQLSSTSTPGRQALCFLVVLVAWQMQEG